LVGGGLEMVKVKEIIFVDKEQNFVRVVLEDNGEEYSFVGDAWEILDEEKFKIILSDWKNRIIPKMRAYKKLNKEGREKLLNKLKRLSV
jgi:hypothetical protein